MFGEADVGDLGWQLVKEGLEATQLGGTTVDHDQIGLRPRVVF